MEINVDSIIEKLGDKFDDEDIEMIKGYLTAAAKYAPLVPFLIEPILDTVGEFSGIIERPHKFTTQMDIDRYKAYVGAGMSDDHAMALMIARIRKRGDQTFINSVNSMAKHTVPEIAKSIRADSKLTKTQ